MLRSLLFASLSGVVVVVGCTAIAGIETPIFEPDPVIDAGEAGLEREAGADDQEAPPPSGPFRCATRDADFCDDFESPTLRIDDAGGGWTAFENVGPVSTLEADGGAFVSSVNGDGGNAIQSTARLVLQREWPFDPSTNVRRKVSFDLAATIEICPRARTRLLEFSPAPWVTAARNYYVLVDFGQGQSPDECVARVLSVDVPPDGGTQLGHSQLDAPITVNVRHRLRLDIEEQADGIVRAVLVIDGRVGESYVLSFAVTRAPASTTAMSAYVGVLGFEDRIRVIVDDVLINYQR